MHQRLTKQEASVYPKVTLLVSTRLLSCLWGLKSDYEHYSSYYLYVVIHACALIPWPNNRTKISGLCIWTDALLSMYLDQFSCEKSEFDLRHGAGFCCSLWGHPGGEVIPGPRSSAEVQQQPCSMPASFSAGTSVLSWYFLHGLTVIFLFPALILNHSLACVYD